VFLPEMSSKPAIVIVPGSFAPPELYNGVAEPLRTKGYELSIANLKTVGKKPGPLPTIYDDAAAIAEEVTKFADEGKDVVIIAHSYGGIPTSEAVKGLTKAQREKEGKKGGIIRLGYLSCLVPAVGTPAVADNTGNAAAFELIVPDAVSSSSCSYAHNIPTTPSCATESNNFRMAGFIMWTQPKLHHMSSIHCRLKREQSGLRYS
jgi:hypothetical protein